MTAKTQLLDYASKYNDGKVYSNEEFVGMMITDGCVIYRTPQSKTIANVKREGKTIIVTETTKAQTTEIANGKLVFGETINTVEIFRVDYDL